MRIFRWRKKPNTGSHSFSWEGKRYSTLPGEVVVCPMEVMGSFVVEYDAIGEIVEGTAGPVEGDGPVLEQDRINKEAREQPVGLELVHRGGGYYDVVNPDNPDKPLNDKALRKDAALEVIEAVENGEEIPESAKRKRSK